MGVTVFVAVGIFLGVALEINVLVGGICVKVGGGVSVFDKELQSKNFDLLGFTKEEADIQFGFLMNAFEFGAPPHGGIAFGLDRLCAVMSGSNSIRDFIAFPKNNQGRDVMIEAPAAIDKAQLKELGLELGNI